MFFYDDLGYNNENGSQTNFQLSKILRTSPYSFPKLKKIFEILGMSSGFKH